MTYCSIVISSGHGKYVRGAAGDPGLDEVDESRRVVERVADKLEQRGVDVVVYHDNTSQTQGENLSAIVAAHNAQARELDVSIHFNAFDTTAHGVEVLYLTQPELAASVSAAIAAHGFTDRGAKYRDDLKFLNATDAPAILVETCFCDCPSDCATYEKHFDEICEAIATVLGGDIDMEEIA